MVEMTRFMELLKCGNPDATWNLIKKFSTPLIPFPGLKMINLLK
jgi:hypothetical protein